MSKRQTGFTKAGSAYPAFVNITAGDEGVTVTARGDAKPDGSCGETVSVGMTKAEFRKFIDSDVFAAD